MNRDRVNTVKLEFINPADDSMFVPLNQMYLGVKVMRER